MNENYKPSKRVQDLQKFLDDASKVCSLESIMSFVETINAPHGIGTALMTGRSELISLVPRRDMNKDEVAVLLDVIRILIETNSQLRGHAQLVAQSVKHWSEAFAQLHSIGEQIERFANFEPLFKEPGDG